MEYSGTPSNHPLYSRWMQIKRNTSIICCNSIPNRWYDFHLFLNDLPNKPISKDENIIYVLKRIDKYSPYSKSNIHWKKTKTKLNSNKSKHPLYNTWNKIKQKARLGGNKSIPKHWDSFDLFLKDLPKRYISKDGMYLYILKRTDKYLPYSKSNIHFKKIKIIKSYNTYNTNKINTSTNTTTNISTEIPDLD